MGWSAAVADRKMWADMKMSPTDLADVSGYTYTYLMNGQAPDGNWTGIFKPGEKIRLRFINASAMTYFDVRIPGLKTQEFVAKPEVTLACQGQICFSVPNSGTMTYEAQPGTYGKLQPADVAGIGVTRMPRASSVELDCGVVCRMGWGAAGKGVRDATCEDLLACSAAACWRAARGGASAAGWARATR